MHNRKIFGFKKPGLRGRFIYNFLTESNQIIAVSGENFALIYL
jgi:hypothetical protein